MNPTKRSTERVSRTTSARSIARLLDDPTLTGQLATLSGQELKSLVGQIGLEVAGEVLSLVAPPRPLALMDDELWVSDSRGSEAFGSATFRSHV